MLKKSSIHVRLPEPLKQALEARAKREGEFPAEVIRRAIERYLGPPRKAQRSDE